MKRCLLTGATGFVGSHVAKVLARTGWSIVAVKRPSSSIAAVAELPIDWVDADQVDRVWGGEPFRAVVHVATNYGRGDDPPSRLSEDNTLFPLRLLEKAIQHGVPAFLNTDTCFTTDYKYLRPYTLSKKQFVQWGKILSEGTATKFVNLVLQHPYGPGDRASKFVPAMARQCLTSTATIDLTPGEQKKDFVYVGDVAEAYQIVLAKAGSLANFTEFQVGSGKAVSIRQFVELLHRLSQSKATLRFGGLPYRDAEIMFSQADPAPLLALGWRPIVSLEEGLLRLLRDDFGHANLLQG